MRKDEIRQKILEQYNENINMWYVAIIYKDALNVFNTDYAYFYSRYDAEKWFSEKIEDKLGYYGYCCDDYHWHNIEDLVEDI